MNLDALTSKPDGGRSAPPVPAPKRRWITRVALPALVLLITGGLFAYAARDTLLPGRPVRVVRVVAKERAADDGSVSSAAATIAVQAPGWVEPDPYPVYVTALADGVIEQVLVLEGEAVEAGQEVAKMVDDDARLALARAEAELSRRRALLEAAQTDWDHPVALRRAVAVTGARVAEAKAALARLEADISQQIAKLKELTAAYDRVRDLSGGAASRLEVETARYQLDAQQALVEATRQQRPVLEAQGDRYQAELQAARDDLRLRVDQKRAVAEAAASVAEADAAWREAKLRLKRMTITSPVAGIVMRRMVAPGAKLRLAMDSPHSAHVVHVYDPKQLQVRVDVPLADAAKVGVVQRARVVVDVLPDQQFTGRVTRFVHQADISKNTVEVKVAIEDPSPLLKPDMLARAKFLASAAGDDAAGAAGTLTTFVPQRAVAGQGDEAHVWLVMPDDSRLRRRPVTLGGRRTDGWVAVVEGLRPGDVLVADPSADLEEGERVTIAGVEEAGE